MPFIGVQPATVPLTSSDITDGIISTAKIADDAVTGAKIENSPTIANSLTVANGLTLTDGNLVVASGHGIDFSATSDESGMTGELMDNYEEGSFTPSFVGASSGITYSSQLGRYTLIGDLCTIYISMTYSLSGFSGFNLRIAKPFTGHASIGQDMQGGVLMRTTGLADDADTANNDAYTFGIYNGQDIYVYQMDGTVRNSTGHFKSGTIAGSFTYKIA